jgi:hypothetical protein
MRFGESISASTAAVLVGALFLLPPLTGQAQETEYVAPRSDLGDGKPDLSGIWQAVGTAHWDLLSHSQGPGPVAELGAMFFVPPGLGVVEDDEIPYQPWAVERKKHNFENRLVVKDLSNHEFGDPELKCFMPGIPRATYMPYPFQILQGQREILFVYQFGKANRVVHMNERVESLVDSWMGISNGRWEGDTLVTEVTGLNGQAWLDRAGNFFSNNARVVERYTPISPYHLEYEATIHDSTVFTRPWTIRMPLYRVVTENAELLEVNCVEIAEPSIYGDIRRLTEEDFGDDQ